jgi:two-component system sensor histidine kinase CiaH
VATDASPEATGPAGAGGATRPDPDAALLRQTRLRLMALSGGLTLLTLALLGGALYTAVARSLDARGTAVVEHRAEQLAQFIQRPGQLPDRPFPGPDFGGQTSGTVALVVRPDGSTVIGADIVAIDGFPDDDSIEAARADGSDVRQASIQDIPVRVYSMAVDRGDGQYVIQVVGDRSSEQQLLDTLTVVLAFGGLLALVAAIGFGYIYAGRALVPIRASLARRNEALRRQREFTANASHELRSPLTVIRTSVTDLRRNPGQPVGQVGTALDDIDGEVVHLTALVDDMLLLARTDSGVVELEHARLDLADVAAETVGGRTTVASARGVAVVVYPRPAEVDGDPLRLRQLITILVDNAIAHSPGGSTVMVRIRPEGAMAALDVEDQGHGIRAEDLPHVFERFWRADDAPEGGTGLGLSIAAWIVERHGGTVLAENRPEGGARLAVRLPLATRVTQG